jgi:membrane-bound lytic murein transglycosylase MltF
MPKQKKAKQETPKRQFKTDQEMLDHMKTTIMDQIQDGNLNLKVGDLLKIFEIQKKLSSDSKT